MPISDNVENVGIRITAEGVVETANGIRLTNQQVRELGQGLLAASGDSRAFASGQQQATTAADAFVRKLREEADTLGMTSLQVKAHQASQMELTAAQHASAEASLQQIRSHEKYEASLVTMQRVSVFAYGAISAAIAAVVKASISAATEYEQSVARMNAVTRGSGYGAGLTRADALGLSETLSGRALFKDDEIRNAISLMMTYRAVSGDTFRESMSLAADLAATMRTDLSTAVRMLGRAFEDPEQGLQSLRRAGVAFTDSQKDMIRGLLETGRHAEAVTAIMQILKDRGINGVSDALKTGLTGSIDNAGKSWNDFLVVLGRSSVVQGPVTYFLDTATTRLRNLKNLIEDGGWLQSLGVFLSSGMYMPKAEYKPPRQLTPAELLERGQASQGAQQAQWERDFNLQTRNLDTWIAGQLKPGPRGAASAADPFDAKLKSLQQQRIAVEELTTVERLLMEMEEGHYGRLSPLQQDALIAEAARIDLAREDKKTREEAWRFAEQSAVRQIAASNREAEAIEHLTRKYKDMIDPIEPLRRQLGELDKLLEMNKITAVEYAEAVFLIQNRIEDLNLKAKDAKDGGLKELQNAIDGWGRDVSRDIGRMVVDGELNLRRLGDAFKNLAAEIVAMQVHSQWVKPLLGGASGYLSGLFGGGTTAFYEHQGGIVGSEHSGSSIVNLAAFRNAKRYHAGGIAADEVPIIARKGEGVFTEQQMRRLAPADAAPAIQINITNKGAPVQAQQQGAPRFDGRRWVVDIILDDASRNGPITKSLGSTFGLRRQ